MKHQDLTGRGAVHPFAFVQATDPALDPDNAITRRKAWVDTSAGNALKIRNETNDGWTTILAGAGGVTNAWAQISYVDVVVAPWGTDYNDANDDVPQIDINPGFVELVYV